MSDYNRETESTRDYEDAPRRRRFDSNGEGEGRYNPYRNRGRGREKGRYYDKGRSRSRGRGYRRFGDRDRRPPRREKNENTIFVGNLSYSTTEDTLRATFEDCGTIKRVSIPQGDRGSKGFGFIEFEDVSSIEGALKLDGMDLEGRQIRVRQ